MNTFDPSIFLHPAQYHDGGIALLPIGVLVVGVALFGFGAWQLVGAKFDRDADEERPEASAE